MGVGGPTHTLSAMPGSNCRGCGCGHRRPQHKCSRPECAATNLNAPPLARMPGTRRHRTARAAASSALARLGPPSGRTHQTAPGGGKVFAAPAPAHRVFSGLGFWRGWESPHGTGREPPAFDDDPGNCRCALERPRCDPTRGRMHADGGRWHRATLENDAQPRGGFVNRSAHVATSVKRSQRWS